MDRLKHGKVKKKFVIFKPRLRANLKIELKMALLRFFKFAKMNSAQKMNEAIKNKISRKSSSTLFDLLTMGPSMKDMDQSDQMWLFGLFDHF